MGLRGRGIAIPETEGAKLVPQLPRSVKGGGVEESWNRATRAWNRFSLPVSGESCRSHIANEPSIRRTHPADLALPRGEPVEVLATEAMPCGVKQNTKSVDICRGDVLKN